MKNSSGRLHLAQDGTGQELVLQELGGQGVDVNCIQEGMQVLGSALHIPADPVCAGLVDLQGSRHVSVRKCLPFFSACGDAH